jgi:hypothetical protein
MWVAVADCCLMKLSPILVTRHHGCRFKVFTSHRLVLYSFITPANRIIIIKSNASAECIGSGSCNTLSWPFDQPSQNQNNQSSSQSVPTPEDLLALLLTIHSWELNTQIVQCTPTAEDFLALSFYHSLLGFACSRRISRSLLHLLVLVGPCYLFSWYLFTWFVLSVLPTPMDYIQSYRLSSGCNTIYWFYAACCPLDWTPTDSCSFWFVNSFSGSCGSSSKLRLHFLLHGNIVRSGLLLFLHVASLSTRLDFHGLFSFIRSIVLSGSNRTLNSCGSGTPVLSVACNTFR